MSIIKPRPVGYAFIRKPVKLPPRNPSSFQVVLAGVKRRLMRGFIGRFIRDAVVQHPHIIGEHASSCEIDPTAAVTNAMLNANSGRITIGQDAFLSHGVCLIAGSHDFDKVGQARQRGVLRSGCDIVIESGVWIATNAIVIGPCKIGKNAVVAAGAVVTHDVPEYAVVAGVPARVVKILGDRADGS